MNVLGRRARRHGLRKSAAMARAPARRRGMNALPILSETPVAVLATGKQTRPPPPTGLRHGRAPASVGRACSMRFGTNEPAGSFAENRLVLEERCWLRQYPSTDGAYRRARQLANPTGIHPGRIRDARDNFGSTLSRTRERHRCKPSGAQPPAEARDSRDKTADPTGKPLSRRAIGYRRRHACRGSSR